MARTGRPSSIDSVVAERRDPDGTLVKVTVADRVLQSLRSGTRMVGVANAVGVDCDTIYGWMREGAKINQRLASSKTNRSALSARARRLADFSVSVIQAQGEWEVNSNALLEQLGRGGLKTTIVTEKVDSSGNLLERTERVETLLPSAAVLLARLRMRYPEGYSNRLELSGPEGAPIAVEDRARNLAEAVRDFQAGAEAGRDRESEKAEGVDA